MLSTMERLLGSFVSVLEQLAENVSASALGGSLLGPRDAVEAARLSMGEERPEYLSAPLVHEAFAGCGCQVP